MSDDRNKNARFPPAIASDSKNLCKVDKVIRLEKLRGKFCDFGRAECEA